MKRLLFLGSLMAIVIVLSACGDDIPNFKDEEFEVEEEKTYLPNAPVISFSDFLKHAKGKGWKHLSSYEINKDGSIEKEEFYEGVDGGGPAQYYFEEKEYIRYSWYSAIPINAYSKVLYTYLEEGNYIGYIPKDSEEFFTQFQVLYIDENILKVVEWNGLKAYKNKYQNIEYQNIYTFSTYQKMSEDELKEYQENYVNIEDVRK